MMARSPVGPGRARGPRRTTWVAREGRRRSRRGRRVRAEPFRPTPGCPSQTRPVDTGELQIRAAARRADARLAGEVRARVSGPDRPPQREEQGAPSPCAEYPICTGADWTGGLATPRSEDVDGVHSRLGSGHGCAYAGQSLAHVQEGGGGVMGGVKEGRFGLPPCVGRPSVRRAPTRPGAVYEAARDAPSLSRCIEDRFRVEGQRRVASSMSISGHGSCTPRRSWARITSISWPRIGRTKAE